MARSDQEQSKQQMIQNLAQWIVQRRLNTPAILALEVVEPFSFLVGQALLLGEPLLGFLFEGDRIAAYADLLSERRNVAQLIACLTTETGDPAGR